MGQTYAFEPNEVLASDLELTITSSISKAERDGVLVVATEISNPRAQKARFADAILGEVVETDLLSDEQTVTAIAKELQKLPEEQVNALTQSSVDARKLVVNNLNEWKHLIRKQVNWDNSSATVDQKEEFDQKVLFQYIQVFTVHDDEISDVAQQDAQFEIKTTGEPIYQWPRPLSHATLAAINEEVKKLLHMGCITEVEWSRESESLRLRE